MIEQIEQNQPQDTILDMAASPAFGEDGICFAAKMSGLYRTDDAGYTWQRAYKNTSFNSALTTAAIALSPTFASDYCVFAGVSGGVLRSVDGGETWQIAQFPTPPPFVSVLKVSPNFEQDGTIFAGTLEDGVFYSHDRGVHWVGWNFGLLDLEVLSLAISPDFVNDETLFVGTDSGIYISTNGGRAWREANLPMEYAPITGIAVSPQYHTDSVLFAVTESCGLFRFTDRGATWTRISPDRLTDSVKHIILSPDYPAKPDLLVMLDDGLLISRDNGDSWHNWDAKLDTKGGLAWIVAPKGLDAGAPLLIGLANGDLMRL